jgi:hypothetical protein
MSDEYYIAAAAKRRGLGLVKFIGELYKLGMLTESCVGRHTSSVVPSGLAGKLVFQPRSNSSWQRFSRCMSPEIKDENIRDRNGTVVAGGSLFRKYLLNRCQTKTTTLSGGSDVVLIRHHCNLGSIISTGGNIKFRRA